MTTSPSSARPPEYSAGQPEVAPGDHPHTRNAFRNIRLFVRGYIAISVLALVAIVLLRNHSAEVNSAVWTRAIIVLVTAVLMARFTARAAGGSRGAYRRLRIVSIVATVAIVVIVALPGTFPVWMRIEQGVCGLVMLKIALAANGRHLRQTFAASRAT